MRITSHQLRRIIREALNEKKYHEPVHVRGYEREGYTTKDGTKVKATYVRPHKSEWEGYEREYTPQSELDEADDLLEKEYHASAGSKGALKRSGGKCEKAVKAGMFDWSDEPWAACNAAKIATTGSPTVKRGSKCIGGSGPHGGGKGCRMVKK